MSEKKNYKESPLLSSVYYLQKSISPKHITSLGKLNELINKENSVIIIPDEEIISKNLHTKLNDWIYNGGTLIRFAGNNLVNKKSEFLSAEGVSSSIRFHKSNLNLEKKISILPFEKSSIFYGLNTPKEFNISKQLIFNSSSDDFSIIAKLNDNTPLVSIRNSGKGNIILFHVSANNSWSDIPLSSLFPKMLDRLLLYSKTTKSIL